MSLPPLFGCNFPSYIKTTFNEHVNIYWYDPEFTQSRYPPGQERISKACTLICVLVAQRICQRDLLINDIEKCPDLNIIMAEAMLEGNAKHLWILQNGIIQHDYLSAEEALKYAGRRLKEWKFCIFCENIGEGLYKNMKSFLDEWYKEPRSKNLFMLLITCGRTILFIFQNSIQKVTLFDSHRHCTIQNLNRGLLVAQTGLYTLEMLCDWYCREILNDCCQKQPEKYELAFLYPCSPSWCSYNESISKCNRNT